MVTVVLTVISFASNKTYYSINRCIRVATCAMRASRFAFSSQDLSGSIGCADARGPLHSWYEEALKAKWRRPQDIKDQFASASICGNHRVVFDTSALE